MSSIANILAGAHKTLDEANKFQASAGGPYHEHSNASYSVARAARPGAPKSSTNTGSELAEKAKNVENYTKGVSEQ